MANLTRPDEALALRTTLLCGLVVVLEGYDLSTLGFVVPQLARGVEQATCGVHDGADREQPRHVRRCSHLWLARRSVRPQARAPRLHRRLRHHVAADGVRRRYHAARPRTPGDRRRARRWHSGVHRAGVRRQSTAPARRSRDRDDYRSRGWESVCRYRGGAPAPVVWVGVRLHRRRCRADLVVAACGDIPTRILGISGDSSRPGCGRSVHRVGLRPRPRGGALCPWCRRRDGAALGHQLSQPAHDLLRELLVAVNASRHGSDAAGRHSRDEHVLLRRDRAPRL